MCHCHSPPCILDLPLNANEKESQMQKNEKVQIKDIKEKLKVEKNQLKEKLEVENKKLKKKILPFHKVLQNQFFF